MFIWLWIFSSLGNAPDFNSSSPIGRLCASHKGFWVYVEHRQHCWRTGAEACSVLRDLRCWPDFHALHIRGLPSEAPICKLYLFLSHLKDKYNVTVLHNVTPIGKNIIISENDLKSWCELLNMRHAFSQRFNFSLHYSSFSVSHGLSYPCFIPLKNRTTFIPHLHQHTKAQTDRELPHSKTNEVVWFVMVLHWLGQVTRAVSLQT